MNYNTGSSSFEYDSKIYCKISSSDTRNTNNLKVESVTVTNSLYINPRNTDNNQYLISYQDISKITDSIPNGKGTKYNDQSYTFSDRAWGKPAPTNTPPNGCVRVYYYTDVPGDYVII
jgi:hypothetical protein